MAESAYAEALKASVFGLVGSSPTTRTYKGVLMDNENFEPCTTPDCWCGAQVQEEDPYAYVYLPLSIMSDIVENGFQNVRSLDFVIKSFETSI